MKTFDELEDYYTAEITRHCTNFARLAQPLMRFGNAWIKYAMNMPQNTRNFVLRQ